MSLLLSWPCYGKSYSMGGRKNRSPWAGGRSVAAILCWTGPPSSGNFSHCSFWMPLPSICASLSPSWRTVRSAGVLWPIRTGYAISPKRAQLSGQKDFLASLITFTWRLLPGLLYLSVVESRLKVNDAFRDTALPEQLLVWLSGTSCCSGAISLVIFSLPLQQTVPYLSHE